MVSRIDVTDWRVVDDETAGAEVKLWLQDSEESLWLYKPVVIKSGRRQGEDWSEKIATQVAELLGVPCAKVEMAQRKLANMEIEFGSISLNLRPSTHELQPGFIWMEVVHEVEGYVPGNRADCPKWRPGHSLKNIELVLEDVLPPPNSPLPGTHTAFETFTGYLILDALIANRDRHDENWAVLLPLTNAHSSTSLSGSYDHASSLGFNLTEDERADRILGNRGGVESWAVRGTAWRFEHDPSSGPITLVELAAEALDLCSSAVQDFWKSTIVGIDLTSVTAIIRDIPDMSEPARKFADMLLEINLRRLRDEFNLCG